MLGRAGAGDRLFCIGGEQDRGNPTAQQDLAVLSRGPGRAVGKDALGELN